MAKCKCSLHFHAAIFFFFFFLFFLGINYTNYSNSPLSGGGIKFLLSIEAYKNIEKNKIWEMSEGMGRRLLGGPGSSPPRCTYKCGGCRPCKPVHVAVPPGARMTAEYYPEAWRCKCGNKLYMP